MATLVPVYSATHLRERDERDRLRDELVFRENAYWRKDDPSRAYCTKCLDADGKLITALFFDDGMFRCLNCDNVWPRSTVQSDVRPRPDFIRR